ncbi:unnamed protein product [Ectocarpus sp. CCAP 1310/34]|nr:unnamed protein product [Ectocarpus sp. CCAP 1310/34]
MVAASAEDNTRRAIERGSLTVVERTLEETKKELVESKRIVQESQAKPRCRRRRVCVASPPGCCSGVS